MRFSQALTLAFCIAVSGCLGADSNAGNENQDGTQSTSPLPLAEPTRIGVALDQYRGIEMMFAPSLTEVAAYVPEGFTTTDIGGRARLIFGAILCDGTDAGSRAFVAIQVDPTDPALMGPDIGAYFWEPEHVVVVGEAVAAVYASLGSNHTDAVRMDANMGTISSSTRTKLDTGSHVIEIPVGSLPSAGVANLLGSFREYSAAANGYVYLEATFKAHDAETITGGHARYEAAPGTVAAALIGASGEQPALGFGAVTYDQSVIGFVPWPGA